MRLVTYSMGMSLDGYVVGPDGRFDWTDPADDLLQAFTDEARGIGVHLMGRLLYEAMLYWESPDESWSDLDHQWADVWLPIPKVVFSRTLTSVEGNARLATGSVTEEIESLRSEPGGGEIAIGGAGLAAQAAEAGLIDEYRPTVHPVLVGGGIPYFPASAHRVDLELIASRQYTNGVTGLRYRARR